MSDVILPEWRNWQTQQTQNLPLATTYRFKSGLRHHLQHKASRGFREAFFDDKNRVQHLTGHYIQDKNA